MMRGIGLVLFATSGALLVFVTVGVIFAPDPNWEVVRKMLSAAADLTVCGAGFVYFNEKLK